MTPTATPAGEGMNMRERLARALWEVSAEPEHGATWEAIRDKPWGLNFLAHADAALDALMEPTEGMVRQAERQLQINSYSRGQDLLEGYGAMLTAARAGK